MGRFALKHRLVLITIASIYMAVTYMLISVSFTLEGFLSYELWGEIVNQLITSVKDFSMVFWFAFLGSFFWAASCYLLAASVSGFFRITSVIAAISATVWTILLFYLAIDFKSIFIDVAYSYDLSHLLARTLPYLLTAINCLSLVLFAAGLALRFRSVMISFVSALALSVFTISAAAFLINLNRFLPSAFFVIILPAGFSLIAVASFRASLECKS